MIQMAFLSISHLAYRAQKIHRTANIIVSDNWGSGVSVAAQIEKKIMVKYEGIYAQIYTFLKMSFIEYSS